MEIKTKYQVGDKIVAFDVMNGKLVEFEVSRIGITIEKNYLDIRYYKDCANSYSQQVCAKSRMEFIESL